MDVSYDGGVRWTVVVWHAVYRKTGFFLWLSGGDVYRRRDTGSNHPCHLSRHLRAEIYIRFSLPSTPVPITHLNLLSRYLPGNIIHSEIEMCPHHRFGTPAPHRSIMSLLPTARIEHLCLLASADNVSAFKYLVENTCFELSGILEDEFLQEFFVERTGGNILHVAARRGAVGMSLNSYPLSVSL